MLIFLYTVVSVGQTFLASI